MEITMGYGLPWWLSGKASTCSAGDTGDASLIPGSGTSPGEGNGNPLQYSCLENQSHGQRSLMAKVHRVRKSRTWLKWLSTQCTEKWDLLRSQLFRCGIQICIQIFLTAQPLPTLPLPERSSAYLPSSFLVTSSLYIGFVSCASECKTSLRGTSQVNILLV